MKERSSSTLSSILIGPLMGYCILLAILASVAGCNRGPGQAAKAMLHLHRGNELVEQGNIREAVAEFKKAVELHPDNNLARLKLADNLMRMGQANQAIDHLKRIEQADPMDRSARAMLAKAFEQAGMWEEAITRYEHLIFAEPGAWELKLNLGQLYRTIGRFVAAQREFALLIKERPRLSQPYNSMGNLYAEPELLSTLEAIECFERSVALWPNNFMALYNLGLAHSNLGWEKSAEEYFRKTLELMPDFAFSHLQLGLIEEKRGHDDKAEEYFRKALFDMRCAPFALTRLAMRMIAKGQTKEAVQPLQTATRLRQNDLYPWEDSAQYLLAGLLLKDGKDKEAVACLEKAVQFNGGAFKAMKKLAEIYQKQGDEKKAKEFAASAKEMEENTLASKKAADHFSKAFTAYRNKDVQKAKAEATASHAASARLSPQRNLDAMMLLGKIAFEARDMDEAGKWFSAACASQPLSGLANGYRGLVLEKRGKHEDAYKVLFDASKVRPYDLPLNLALARVAFGLKKNKEALDAYQAALVIDANEKTIEPALAAVYKALGKGEPGKLAKQDVEVAKEKAAKAQASLEAQLKAEAERRAQAQARAKAAAKAKKAIAAQSAGAAPKPEKTPKKKPDAAEAPVEPSAKTKAPPKETKTQP